MKNGMPAIFVSVLSILLLFGFALTAQAGNDLQKAADARESAAEQVERNREKAEQKREAAREAAEQKKKAYQPEMQEKKAGSGEHRGMPGEESERGPHHGEHHEKHHGKSYHKDKKDEPCNSGQGKKKGHRHMPEHRDKD